MSTIRSQAPSTLQGWRTGCASSIRSRWVQSDCCFLPAAGCVRSCTRNGATSLPDGIIVRCVDLVPNKRGFGGDEMFFNGKSIGESEKPLYDAARWLLSNNAASESDTLATFRGGTLSKSATPRRRAGQNVRAALRPEFQIFFLTLSWHRQPDGRMTSPAPAAGQALDMLQQAAESSLPEWRTPEWDPGPESPVRGPTLPPGIEQYDLDQLEWSEREEVLAAIAEGRPVPKMN